MVTCLKCGHEASDTARFCTRCGSSLVPPGATPEETPTRRFPEDERPTQVIPGQPTRPAYLPPEPSLSHPATPPPTAAPGMATVNLIKWLSEGWKIYRSDPGTFSIASVVMVLLSLVTLTVLTGPLLTGFYHMVFQAMRGERPHIGDLFKGLDRFWPAVFAWVIEVALFGTLSGASREYPLFSLVSLALTPLVNAVFFFVYPLILERQRDTAAAIDEAIRVVFPRHYLPFWVCGLIFEAIFFLGLLGCGVGFFVTAPFILCAMAVAYRDFFGLAGPWSRQSWPPVWMNQE